MNREELDKQSKFKHISIDDSEVEDEIDNSELATSESRVLNYSVSDFLDLYYKRHNYTKLVLFITPKQTVFLEGNLNDHWTKTILLSQNLFPNKNYNHMRYYEGAISVFSVGDTLDIELPSTIDPVQYECFKELISDVTKYETKNGVKVLNVEAEELLTEAKKRIGRVSEPDEVMITEIKTWKEQWGGEKLEGRKHNTRNITLDSFEENDTIKL